MTIELLLKTFSECQRIWVKVKPIEEPTSSMVSRMFKETILGTLLDASMENQLEEKYSQTMISENQ